MGKRLKTYLEKMEQLNPEQLTEKQRKEITKDLLIQIGFFQHERLIHLIVTVTFALLALISVLSAAALQQPLILLLTALFFILLIPYILHYYLLENGVQKLYACYDNLRNAR